MAEDILKINKKLFLAALKEWDKYTFVLLKKLAKEMPTSFEMDSYHQQHITAPFADEINLSDLSELIWKSLQSGADRVDTIHDEIFFAEQVEYFKDEFGSVETILSQIENSAHLFVDPNSSEPMSVFVKIGKPAQLKIIEEGFLEIAVSNHDQAVSILQKRYDEALKEHEDQRKENKINLRVKKAVRVNDQGRCVYCGRDYNYHSFSYSKIDSTEPFNVDNVVLACNSCLHQLKKAEKPPSFGRFAAV